MRDLGPEFGPDGVVEEELRGGGMGVAWCELKWRVWMVGVVEQSNTACKAP